MLAYLVSAGFDKVVSDKDFPLKDRTGKWGAPDHLVFERMLADLAAARKERGIHIEDGEDEPEVFTEEYETELHAHESDNADLAEAAACENAEDKIEEREE